LASIARIAAWLGLLAPVFLLLVNYSGVNAVELLQNGGFEQGALRWTPNLGFSTSGCAPRMGGGVGVLTTSNQESAFVRQNISSTTLGASYTFRGFARAESGAAGLTVSLIWIDVDGRPRTDPLQLQPTAEWAEFSLTRNPASDAVRMAVEARTFGSEAGVICLDDLSLDGPLPPTATPTPTATPIATVTPEPTLSPTPEPTSTSTIAPPATATSPADAPTASPVSPVPTATVSLVVTATAAPPTATASAIAGPSFIFTNGGFENGTAGWQKFGGELRTVASPRGSGSSAGAFESSTAATKWAFQPVRIDASLAYEFKGYLQPESGIVQAFLRISWYTSADASGQAVATDDSTAKLGGASSGFTYLTTGPRTPPANARSARLRVVLAPAGAGSATLYLDDFSFGVAVPQAGPPPPASAAPAADEPFEAPAVPAPAGLAFSEPSAEASVAASVTKSQTPRGTQTATRSATPQGTLVTTSGTVEAIQATPAVVITVASRSIQDSDLPEADDGRSLPQMAGIAVVLFAATLGGAYIVAKRQGRTP
jgi:hypothetical protein